MKHCQGGTRALECFFCRRILWAVINLYAALTSLVVGALSYRTHCYGGGCPFFCKCCWHFLLRRRSKKRIVSFVGAGICMLLLRLRHAPFEARLKVPVGAASRRICSQRNHPQHPRHHHHSGCLTSATHFCILSSKRGIYKVLWYMCRINNHQPSQ